MRGKRADILRRSGSAWRRYWFEPEPPENLALCRVIFFGAVFLYFLRADFSVCAGEVSSLFWRPTWVHRHLFAFVGPPREDVVAGMQFVWKVALALSCVGLLTRVATVAAFVLGLYLLGLPYNYGIVSHMTAAPVFVFGIMALARCADAWSLDRLIATARGRRDSVIARPVAGGEYRWPVRMVWVLLSLVFFGAGVSKLRHSGLAWVTSDTMQRLLWLAHHPVGPTTAPFTRWGLWVAEYPLLCTLAAAGTIVFEAGYPLALFFRRLRVVFVSSMVLMLVGVRLLLGPPFELLIICHAFWMPLDKLAHRAYEWGVALTRPDRGGVLLWPRARDRATH